MVADTPEATLQLLMDGNQRFVEGRSEHPRQDRARRDAVIGGQKPMAAILGCADSRVPPELVFDQGLGDLFVVRGAGEVADDTNLGSLEYAVANLGVRLIVVLGHTDCGAVSAAVASADAGDPPEGYVAAVLDAIDTVGAESDLSFEDRVDATVRDHTQRTADLVRNAAPVLNSRVASGDLLVVAAVYRLTDGRIELLD
jgi:carbonic anhydrase